MRIAVTKAAGYIHQEKIRIHECYDIIITHVNILKIQIYMVAQNKIPHQTICSISTTSGLILTRNSSADEIANVNFLRRHRTRTRKRKKREKQTVNKQSLNSPQLISYS